MAAYPTFPMQRDGTAWQREAGIVPTRATNGVLKVRRIYSADKRSFVATHWLSDTDKATLEAHYSAHRAVSFSMAWPHDGASYTVVYAGAPQYELRDGFVVATVPLLEV